MQRPQRPRIRAVLFDLGETLLDSGGVNPDFRTADQRDFGEVYDYLLTLAQMRPELRDCLPDRAEFVERFFGLLQGQWDARRRDQVGISVADVLAEGLSGLGLRLSEAEAGECLRRHFAWYDAHDTLYPEVLSILRLLKRQGYKLGLISNTIWPGRCHDRLLERLGLAELFDVRLYSSDVGVQKPHPRIFQQALAALGVRPEEAVFVGDRLAYDILGAQQVGMKAVLRIVPYREERDPSIVPDATIRSLEELPELLNW